MNILAIDPGAEESGWCLYDTSARRVVASGRFKTYKIPCDLPVEDARRVVIERPKAYFRSPPAITDCGYVCGRIVERLLQDMPEGQTVDEIERYTVRRVLQEETHGVIAVKGNPQVWHALKLLHGGDGCDKKGGPLHGVHSHERAALAVAVAFDLRQRTATQASGGAAT